MNKTPHGRYPGIYSVIKKTTIPRKYVRFLLVADTIQGHVEFGHFGKGAQGDGTRASGQTRASRGRQFSFTAISRTGSHASFINQKLT